MTTDTAFIVRRLADRFAEVPNGEIVTLDDLSKTIEQDVRRVRHLIYRAKTLVGNETGAQFATEYRKGYRRLRSDELVKIGQTARKHIRGTSRRASKGIDAGIRVANDLSPQDLNAALREQSALGLIEHLAKDKNLPTVDIDEKRPLTPGQAAKQFLEKIGAINKA